MILFALIYYLEEEGDKISFQRAPVKPEIKPETSPKPQLRARKTSKPHIRSPSHTSLTPPRSRTPKRASKSRQPSINHFKSQQPPNISPTSTHTREVFHRKSTSIKSQNPRKSYTRNSYQSELTNNENYYQEPFDVQMHMESFLNQKQQEEDSLDYDSEKPR